MYFGQININNYKNIENEISVDFQRLIKTENETNSVVMKNKDIAILNKIGVMGKNAIGKTNVLTAINLLQHINQIKAKTLQIKNKNQIVDELKVIQIKVELLDETNVVLYEFNKFHEKITFNKQRETKDNEVDINILRTILKRPNILFSDITFKNINSLVRGYQNKIKYQKIIMQNEIIKIFKLFNVKFKISNNKLVEIKAYTIKMYKQSLFNKMFVTFNGVKMLNINNINKAKVLTYLWNEKEIFNKITIILEQLDYDINNFKIEKEAKQIKLTFTKNRLDFFKCGSKATIKLLLILTNLFYLSNKSSLILIDDLDEQLKPQLVSQILKMNYWNNQQLLFTFNNTNILNQSLNTLNADQITFMRYKDNSQEKEIISLCDFKNYAKYIKQNKVNWHILDNIFNTEIDLEYDINDII